MRDRGLGGAEKPSVHIAQKVVESLAQKLQLGLRFDLRLELTDLLLFLAEVRPLSNPHDLLLP